MLVDSIGRLLLMSAIFEVVWLLHCVMNMIMLLSSSSINLAGAQFFTACDFLMMLAWSDIHFVG